MSRGREAVTIAEALREAATALRVAGLTEALREAGSLLAHAAGRDRTFLITRADEELTGEQLSAFRASVARRAAGEPLQYITGRQWFYGLEFEVTPDVLIPRPETELLVETALELLQETPSPLVCDVGTGSGCIAVALLHARPDARAFALDISPAALRVAESNAARHGVRERMTTLVSDCFAAFEDGTRKLESGERGEAGESSESRFDLIASNPPYVAEDELETLEREVREHEPRAALTPGGDGLSIVRRLVNESPRYLKPRGHLLIEIGYGQSEAVGAGVDPRVWNLLGIRKDLRGIPRTVVLRLTE
ncbi:MAG TPA: peptide chain release factor N(5)-glutamine methyltransferase [Pyrinomonadaceae bacterium]|nr:peptide chain release factor N(5)-glutamine methyltransferase [Pyrinomonadaceae bacterium]